MKKVVVLSLGGSLIAPEEIDIKFLNNFKIILEKKSKDYKFVVVTGGGSIARKYISALRRAGKKEYLQSMAGIAVTRLNARFLTYLFGKDASEGIPHDMKHIETLLKKNDIVFCGALRYHEKETSDSNAAKIAAFLGTDFINLTNVPGLFDKDPKKHKNAKLIHEISAKSLSIMANKMKFQPGQHFVIDQHAMKIILDNKIKLYILGNDLKQFENLLEGKKFIGTSVN